MKRLKVFLFLGIGCLLNLPELFCQSLPEKSSIIFIAPPYTGDNRQDDNDFIFYDIPSCNRFKNELVLYSLRNKGERDSKEQWTHFQEQCLKYSVQVLKRGFKETIHKLEADILKKKRLIKISKLDFDEAKAYWLPEENTENLELQRKIKSQIDEVLYELFELSSIQEEIELTATIEDESGCILADPNTPCTETIQSLDWVINYSDGVRRYIEYLYYDVLTQNGKLRKGLSFVGETLDILFIHTYTIEAVSAVRKRIGMRLFLFDLRAEPKDGKYPIYEKVTAKRNWNETISAYKVIIGPQINQVIDTITK